MTLNRVRRVPWTNAMAGPAVFAAGVVAGFLLRHVHEAGCRRRVERLGDDLTEHLDEVCARLRELGRRLGDSPDLVAEAREAEERAEREERGEVEPLPGQRAKRGPQTAADGSGRRSVS